MPSPEELRPSTSKHVLTFRLDDPELEALRALAARADLGVSTLVRRIVETYIEDHAPREGRKRG